MRKHLKSQEHAWKGLLESINDPRNRNLRIQLVGLIIVLITSVILNISSIELAVILICSAGVIALELMNNAIEELADFITREHHHSIRKVKDIAAAAVLIWALFSIIIGVLIFLPKLINLI